LSTSIAASAVGHLDQFGVDDLVRLSEHRNQILGLSCIVGGEEGVGSSALARPSRSPNSMDVVFRGVRVVEVDHKLYVLNVWMRIRLDKRKASSQLGNSRACDSCISRQEQMKNC
jgi:hypothetical protein